MNPHPPLSSFPFVILSLVVIFETLSIKIRNDNLQAVSGYLLMTLALFAPITYFSGYWGADYANNLGQINPDYIANHQLWAKSFIISLIPTLLLFSLCRSAKASPLRTQYSLRALYLISLSSSFVLVVVVSFYGGDLVFSHGAGVRGAGIK